jgi:hypothetical protein
MHLNEHQKWAVLARYLLYFDSEKEKLPYGRMNILTEELGVSEGIILSIAREYGKATKDNVFYPDLKPKRRCGVPSLLTDEKRTIIHDVNFNAGGKLSIRALKRELQISGVLASKSSVQRWCVSMEEKLTTEYVKPMLTLEHKMRRLAFICSEVDPVNQRFQNQFDTVHIDESWFYLHREHGLVRYFPGDPVYIPTKVAHKKHIPKMMFLTAIGRPQPEHGFDGKIGIWRFSDDYVVQRRSINHEVGDIIQRGLNVNGETYRAMMLDHIMPAMKEKMAFQKEKDLFIQQDGAPGHTAAGNMEIFDEAGFADDWGVSVVTQPAQSPDMNVNDLGFFNSLKAHVDDIKLGALRIEDMLVGIRQAWDEYDSDTIDRIWAHQLSCYREIMKVMGSNDYVAPHSNIRKRQRVDEDCADYSVDMELYHHCMNVLDEWRLANNIPN